MNQSHSVPTQRSWLDPPAKASQSTKVQSVIALLSGGVGAARFALGLSSVVQPEQIRIVSNVGDDEVLHGLHISPDIDTMIYTLGNSINPDTGWGLDGDTWTVMDALSSYGGITWFRIGDRDLATHLFRTQLLKDGESLTAITDRIRARWNVKPKVLPVTDGRLRTVLYTGFGPQMHRLSFQEYFVRYGQQPEISQISYEGDPDLRPTDEVIDCLENARAIVVAPSNPVLSIGPILSVPGIVNLLKQRRDKVVAISPIIAGKAVKGPAAKLMAELALEPSAFGIAQYYSDIASCIIIDNKDEHLARSIQRSLKLKVAHTNTLMDSPVSSANLARTALELVGEMVQ